MSGLSEADTDRLIWLEWGEENFGSLTTGRSFPRRAMLRLVERGLAVSVGPVYICDDDGAVLVPERTREGFRLTDAGQQALAAAIAAFWPLEDE